MDPQAEEELQVLSAIFGDDCDVDLEQATVQVMHAQLHGEL